MKKFYLPLLLIFLVTIVSAQEELTKKGWNFGALPSVAFDADLGFQYGALVNLFNILNIG